MTARHVTSHNSAWLPLIPQFDSTACTREDKRWRFRKDCKQKANFREQKDLRRFTTRGARTFLAAPTHERQERLARRSIFEFWGAIRRTVIRLSEISELEGEVDEMCKFKKAGGDHDDVSIKRPALTRPGGVFSAIAAHYPQLEEHCAGKPEQSQMFIFFRNNFTRIIYLPNSLLSSSSKLSSARKSTQTPRVIINHHSRSHQKKWLRDISAFNHSCYIAATPLIYLTSFITTDPRYRGDTIRRLEWIKKYCRFVKHLIVDFDKRSTHNCMRLECHKLFDGIGFYLPQSISLDINIQHRTTGNNDDLKTILALFNAFDHPQTQIRSIRISTIVIQRVGSILFSIPSTMIASQPEALGISGWRSI